MGKHQKDKSRHRRFKNRPNQLGLTYEEIIENDRMWEQERKEQERKEQIQWENNKKIKRDENDTTNPANVI